MKRRFGIEITGYNAVRSKSEGGNAVQAIMETAFDIAYLSVILYLGFRMVKAGNAEKQYRLFGVMAIVLGAGDAFHLVPRAYALNTVGLNNFVGPLGIGKLVTSVTMTVFYVLLYHVWRARYRVAGRKKLTGAIYTLAIVRVALCLFPQNEWTSANPSLLWGILRNVPFAAMGVILIVLFYRSAKQWPRRSSARGTDDPKNTRLRVGGVDRLPRHAPFACVRE